MVSEELVFLDIEEKNSFDFLDNISNKLNELGYIKDSFKDAIIQREEKFQTGIATEIYNLAIPHTDAEHVLNPGIAFVKFKDTCKFKEMCTDNYLDVHMAFVLLVNKKEEQVELLTKLMGLFSNKDLLTSLYKEGNKGIIVDTLMKEIQ